MASPSLRAQLVARSKARHPTVSVTPPGTPDQLVLEFTNKFSLVVRKRLVSLLTELETTKEFRGDAVSSPLVRIFGKLAIHYADLLSEDLLLLMQSLFDQTTAFNLLELSKLWKSVVGIPYVDKPGVEKKIATYRKKNVSLVKSLVGNSLSTLETVLAANQGQTPQTMAKNLVSAIGVSQSKAKFLARDQILKLNGQLTEDRHRAAGVTQYEWITSGDERVRPTHRALNGKKFSWDNPPLVGKGRHEHPGGDYQCRCVANPVILVG